MHACRRIHGEQDTMSLNPNGKRFSSYKANYMYQVIAYHALK
jgi:hypothetical protein